MHIQQVCNHPAGDSHVNLEGDRNDAAVMLTCTGAELTIITAHNNRCLFVVGALLTLTVSTRAAQMHGHLHGSKMVVQQGTGASPHECSGALQDSQTSESPILLLLGGALQPLHLSLHLSVPLCTKCCGALCLAHMRTGNPADKCNSMQLECVWKASTECTRISRFPSRAHAMHQQGAEHTFSTHMGSVVGLGGICTVFLPSSLIVAGHCQILLYRYEPMLSHSSSLCKRRPMWHKRQAAPSTKQEQH